MIKLPDAMDYVIWIVGVEYHDSAGSKEKHLWNDSDAIVPIKNEDDYPEFNGDYASNHNWMIDDGWASSSSRLEKQEWSLVISDPNLTMRAGWDGNSWRGLSAWFGMVTSAESPISWEFTPWRSGRILGREFATDDRLGRVVRLKVGSPFSFPSTNKRFMEGGFQRALARQLKGDSFVDDSMDLAQKKVDISWGSNN